MFRFSEFRYVQSPFGFAISRIYCYGRLVTPK
uniref:Uncharacterized protein n=1 Tax=Anguilla anguilla TaxID=7936 RepID=A0A0E9PIC1_ANGAN